MPLCPPLALPTLLEQVLAEPAAVPHGHAAPVLPRRGAAARVEVDERGRDLVEERPVVAREDDRPAPAAQLGAQRLHRGIVEVVGRLVEHERVRPTQQEGHERDAAALTSRDGTERRRERDARHAETVEQGIPARVQAPQLRPLGGSERRGVLVRSRGPRTEVARRGLECALDRAQRGDGVLEDGRDRLARIVDDLLGEVADPRGSLHATVVGLIDPGEDAQQGRLARAVLADQAEPRARRCDEIDAVEDEASVEGAREAERAQSSRG